MKEKKVRVVLSAVMFVGLFITATAWGADVVKIGYSGPLSGGRRSTVKTVRLA